MADRIEAAKTNTKETYNLYKDRNSVVC